MFKSDSKNTAIQIIKNTQINCKIRLSQIFKLIKPNKIVKLSFKNRFWKNCFSRKY